MIFAEEDLNSLNAIAGLLASFGFDSQAGCVLYIQHKIAKAMEADERSNYAAKTCYPYQKDISCKTHHC